ncbi:uncharacterized protein Tco025E_02328 [Trypanosoma conorhini]|uniref:Uncharacterized protein n=1 Tax=Trypanosoma conorhini TaxID=83891 RepID=A0A422Q542_9TRYP|nr:uncharacterized protein Tco025E_02328 [Trypanosoma conorhini]RNF25095.1 hypothetical protein Tco025E_02328 [Trypanosoma conorhini]
MAHVTHGRWCIFTAGASSRRLSARSITASGPLLTPRRTFSCGGVRGRMPVAWHEGEAFSAAMTDDAVALLIARARCNEGAEQLPGKRRTTNHAPPRYAGWPWWRALVAPCARTPPARGPCNPAEYATQ